MTTLIQLWADVVINRRIPIIVLTVLLIPALLLTGRPIPFDNTTDRYFVEGDPTLADFDVLLDLFGDNEYLIIGFENLEPRGDILTPDVIDAIDRLTRFLESQPAVTQVRSLVNHQYIHSDGDDLRIDDLVEDPAVLIRDPAAMGTLRERILDEPQIIGTLISADLQHARMTARVEYRRDTAAHKVELVQALYAFVEAENLNTPNRGYALRLSGQPLLNERFESLAEGDTAILIPLMAVVMVAMLLINFRSPTIAALPWLVIGAGVIVVQEIQSYLGLPHTTVDEALIPTLIIIGTGVAVHVVVEYLHLRARGMDGPGAAHQTVLQIWRPALFTAITTAAGFYALSITRIAPVRDFALLGTIGPLVLFLFALSVLPALLSLLPNIPERTQRAINLGGVTRFAEFMPDFTWRHRKIILTASLGLLAFAIFALSALRVDTNYINLFKRDNPVRHDVEYFDAQFKGVMTFEVVFDLGAVDSIKSPEFLESLASFQAWLAARPTVGAMNSLVDVLRQINMALHGDDPAWDRLPDSEEMTAQYLLLYDSAGAEADLSDLKDFDNRYARLTAPIVNLRASTMDAELTAIKNELQANYAHLNPLLTGGMVLFNAQDIYTGQGIIQSFSIALVVISAFFIVLFRSFKYGTLAMVPSVLPILLTGGILGLFGVTLDLSTMVVGAMTMGIAVDDSIHVMNRYLSARRSGHSARDGIVIAMHESGRAVIFSSIVLVFGFLVLTFANFVTIIQVGLFGALIMFLALLGDLLFLPALLYWIDEPRESAHV